MADAPVYHGLMAASAQTTGPAHRALTEGCGLIDRSERGKLALTGHAGADVPQRPGDERRRGARGRARASTRPSSRTRARCSATCASSTRAPSCSCSPSASRCRRCSTRAPRHDRLRRRAAQAHAPARPAVAHRPARRARSPARPTCPRPSTPTARRPSAARRCGSSPPTSASTCCARPMTPSAVRAALLQAGAVEVGEAAAEIVRVESGRPRYGVDLDDGDDPPGGRPQRARGQLHEGLLRRPGDRRAAALEGQAQPPPARPAPVRARSRPATALRRGRARGRARRSAVVSPALGADRARARAPRGRVPARRWRSGTRVATVVDLPFAPGLAEARHRHPVH